MTLDDRNPRGKFRYAAVLLTVATVLWIWRNDSSGASTPLVEQASKMEVAVLTDLERCDASSASSIAAGAAEMRSIRTCSDKFTTHRYQEMYARMLLPYRGLQRRRVGDVASILRAPHGRMVRLLEIGLGCYFHQCAAGGAKLYRTYMSPNTTTYHSLELNVSVCKEKYEQSGVDAQLAQYIDDHLCSGSSADLDVVQSCGDKFGPFDIVIDDGSHMHEHMTFAFRYWLQSPKLLPGGVLVIEDLQVGGWLSMHEHAEDHDAQVATSIPHPGLRGTTAANYAQRLFLCKLCNAFCGPPPAGTAHAMGTLAPLVDEIVLGPEIVGLRKSSLRPPTLSPNVQCEMVDDVALVLQQPQPASTSLCEVSSPDLGGCLGSLTRRVLSRKARIVVVATGAMCRATLQDSRLQKLFESRFGAHTFDVSHLCISQRCGARCVVAVLRQQTATVGLDLLWVVAPFNLVDDAATFASQRELVDLLSDRSLRHMLRPGSAVAVSNFDNAGQLANVATAFTAIAAPLLRFISDAAMHMMLLTLKAHVMRRGPPKKATQNMVQDLPWDAASPEQILSFLNYIGDMSTSSEVKGLLVLRPICDAANRRLLSM